MRSIFEAFFSKIVFLHDLEKYLVSKSFLRFSKKNPWNIFSVQIRDIIQEVIFTNINRYFL